MPEDIPSRIEIMRLKALVNALSMIVSSLSSNVTSLLNRNNIFIVTDTAELSVTDAGAADCVMLKDNDAEDFGIYFPDDAAGTPNGTSIVADINGRKFVLFQ